MIAAELPRNGIASRISRARSACGDNKSILSQSDLKLGPQPMLASDLSPRYIWKFSWYLYDDTDICGLRRVIAEELLAIRWGMRLVTSSPLTNCAVRCGHLDLRERARGSTPW